MLKIPIRWVGKGEPQWPTYQSELAAGMDLCAVCEEPIHVGVGQRVLIPTGIAIALPAGYEAQVRPRSGLAWRHGLTLLNSPGTIDADYRGEISVILINLGQEQYSVQPRERIAQLVVAPVCLVEWEPLMSLPEAARGEGGFGSTGRS